jgi:hypothetical protein
MLHIENIKMILLSKANAKLPIGEKELNNILKRFKKDFKEALTILWIASVKAISDKEANNSILESGITFGLGISIAKVYENWRQDILKPLFSDIVFTTGKQTTGIISDTIESIMKFDMANPTIINHIDTESLRLAVDLRNTGLNNLRQTIVDGVVNNWDKSVTKDFMRVNISLTDKERLFIKNQYLKMIESETQRGIVELKLTPSKARARAERFADQQRRLLVKKKQNQRISRIHRTETTRLKHFSDIESLRQAELTGKINNGFKTWKKSNFKDNWNSSDINNGRTIRYDENWLPGDPTTASSLKYPSEINEHCFQEYKINFKKVA